MPLNVNMHGTVQEIEVLREVSSESPGKLAIMFDSLKRASEIMQSLTDEELRFLDRITTSKPQLFKIVTHTTNEQPVAIIENDDDASMELPEYLTVNDLHQMLGISPQIIRKYCAEKSIKAWRTLGNRGEWRIDIDPYRNHQALKPFLKKRKENNTRLVDTVEKLSQSDAYNEMLERIEASRKRGTE